MQPDERSHGLLIACILIAIYKNIHFAKQE